MRTVLTLSVLLVLVAGCTSEPDRVPGTAAPVGDASSGPTRPAAPPSTTDRPSPPPSATTRPAAGSSWTSSTSRPATDRIRRTDWADVTIRGLSFCGQSGDAARFRNGSNGFDIPCRILPGGATPVYADFLTEEPASAPATEDALVLVELGNPQAARRQALVPVQISADGRTWRARPVIVGDQPNATGDRAMTFESYRVDDAKNQVIATVKRLDGGTETRRYRQTNANGDWQRL